MIDLVGEHNHRAPYFESEARLEAAAGNIAEQGWTLIPDFLQPSIVAGLRKAAAARRAAGGFRPAAIGRASGIAIEPDVRSDQLSWIEPDERAGAINAYLLAMEGLRQAVNQRLYLGLLTLEAQFSIYPPDAYYRRHLDRFRDSNERLLSCVSYLNENWTRDCGGQLRLYLPTNEGAERTFEIWPETGLLVAFLSDRIPHEVLPTKRDRLSIASWFRGRPR